jgi:hypothetical protein
MITSQQFDNALKIIADYKAQLETELFQDSSTVEFVDIQKIIKMSKFYVLKNYYNDILNENLEWSDLKKINISTLEKLDYSHLRQYRGFGKVTEQKLKELVKSFGDK